MSYIIYQSVVNDRLNIMENHKYYLFFGYIVPMMFATVPLVLGNYGPTLLGCWIEVNLSRIN